MPDFLSQGHNLEHVLAFLILIARVGDIGSTYLATPTLKLETNPFARRLKWPMGVLSLGLCLTPYYNPALAVTVLVPSLLVSASNLSRGWVAHAVGEDEMLRFLERAVGRISRRKAVAFTLGAGSFVVLAGTVLLVLSGGQQTWAYWFAWGLLLYGVVIGVYGSLFVLRLHRIGRGALTSTGGIA